MKKYLIIIMVLVLASCVDEFDNTTTTTTTDPDNVIEFFETNVTGIVVNENGIGIPNATIVFGDNTTISNANGAYIFRDVIMNKKGGHIKVYDDEYFFGSTYVYPIAGKTISSQITLMQKGESVSLLSTEGGVAEISDLGGSVVFAPNSFVNEDGGLYNGEVNVFVRYLDPTLNRTRNLMPGALVAQSENGASGNLKSFSMIGVELNTPNGNSLNLAEDATAVIQFPIPFTLVEEAPENIPLWFFNEEEGIWIEEGTASKFANAAGQVVYRGEVSHFSFWNCDVFEDSSFIEGRVVDVDGNGLSNLEVVLTLENETISAYDYTDTEGYYKGYVPQGELFDIEILSACESIYYGTLGPFFNEQEQVPDILIIEELIDSLFINVSGVIMDCNGNNIPLAKIQLLENGEFVRFYNANIDGIIEFVIDHNCYTGELAMFGYDRNNIMTTDTFYFGYQEELELGNWVTCNEEYPNEFTIYYGQSGFRFFEEVSFDFPAFEVTATDNDSDLAIEFHLDNYIGPEMNYTQLDGGVVFFAEFGDCTAESLLLDSMNYFIKKETSKFIEGEFTNFDWTAINESQTGCFSSDEIPFIGGAFILRK